MSDLGDRGGRQRRRRRIARREPGSERLVDYDDTSPTTTPTRPPIILAKPHADRGNAATPTDDTGPLYSINSQSPSTQFKLQLPEKTPIVMLRQRDDSSSSARGAAGSVSVASSGGQSSTSSGQIPSLLGSDLTHSYQPSQGRLGSSSSSSGFVSGSEGSGGVQSRLAPPPQMSHCVKLVDDSMQWRDTGIEYLIDQTNFLIVGVLGLQGVGKSTIMSLLAGCRIEHVPKSFVFLPQSASTREIGSHQTMGIDLYVSAQRVFFLDTQPLLSPALLDSMIHHEKKYPAEFNTAENCIEMQSLQLTAFMMTVCHVILVAQDWFTDLNLLRFLQTAAMLKPSAPAPVSESLTGDTHDVADYQPQIVFVQNKASREEFSVDGFRMMQSVIEKVFDKSNLKMRDGVTIANGKLITGLNQQNLCSRINLFPLPRYSDDDKKCNEDTILTLLPEYHGYPCLEDLIKSLRHQIFSAPRHLFTHTILSEKDWFHYAARTWEQVKKSQMMAEYNRLLA